MSKDDESFGKGRSPRTQTQEEEAAGAGRTTWR